MAFFSHLGHIAIMLKEGLFQFPKVFKNFDLTVSQMYTIGYGSLPLIALTSAFTGMVATVQTAYQVREYVPLEYLGVGVGKAIMLELAPVTTALVLAGRAGAAMAAEIGTMKVTEQIDALEAFSIDPNRYLFMPRFLASLIMLPILVIFANSIGILSSIGVANVALDIEVHTFAESLRIFFRYKDLIGSVVKSLFFGGIIATMGCHYGFMTQGGAEGVGKATTGAVVAASVLILVSDYFVGALVYA